MLAKRDYQSDTWLVIGLSAIAFAVFGAIGIWIACYRRRGHKRLMDKRRLLAARTQGDYVRLDEEKADSVQGVPLSDRAETSRPHAPDVPRSHSHTRSESRADLETEPLNLSTPPSKPEPRRTPSPRPDVSPEFEGLGLPDMHGQALFLPPPAAVVSHDAPRRPSSPTLGAPFREDHDYDGRTGHRYGRSRSPSPNPGRLVLSRSASMLGPR